MEARVPSEDPSLAIILAAGNGQRLQDGRRPGPKPLFELGGLGLLERSVLTLRAAGIRRVRVVVGNQADAVVAGVAPRLAARGVEVEWVRCDGYAAGNGAS